MAGGAAVLLAAEVNAGIEVFKLLEPEVQKGFIALFHLFHKKHAAEPAPPTQPAGSAASNEAEKPAKPDLSSTSLDPENPFASDT